MILFQFTKATGPNTNKVVYYELFSWYPALNWLMIENKSSSSSSDNENKSSSCSTNDDSRSKGQLHTFNKRDQKVWFYVSLPSENKSSKYKTDAKVNQTIYVNHTFLNYKSG